MALSILNSTHSFVRFSEAAAPPYCIWGNVNFCLPVFADADINFQFIIEGDEGEIDSLCTQDASEVEVAIVSECNTEPLLVFTAKPNRFRLSATQVLYNWEHGLPNFTSVVEVGQCFKIQVTILETYGYSSENVFCSNCLERIADDCFTSVIEYGDDTDAFGFKYCTSGGTDEPGTGENCEPTIVQFVNVATLAIPYTAGLQNKYGLFPTVQVWVYDGMGQLVNMGITAAFDTYPPTMINLDFGGVGSGIVVIR